MENNLEIIIDTYGYEKQSRKAIEELGELTVAINKYIDSPLESNFNNLVEEIADVEIMLGQLKIIHDIDNDLIDRVKKEKINRELSRINKDKGLKHTKVLIIPGNSPMFKFYNECTETDFDFEKEVLEVEEQDEKRLETYMREQEKQEIVKVFINFLNGYCNA